MGTVVAQHQNQHYSRSTSQISDGLISSPSRGFNGMNCRIFHSTTGILSSPRAVMPAFNSPLDRNHLYVYSEPTKQSRRSNPILISPSLRHKTLFADDMYSELWAGPAYSCSPPPSSLPIPKFSLRQKCASSLELQFTEEMFDLKITETETNFKAFGGESAPPLTTELSSPPNDLFFGNAHASENLRRILNLDVSVI